MLKTLTIKGVEFSLPDYMNAVPHDVLSLLEMSPDIERRILCCGVDSENILYLITGNAELRKIEPNGYLIPSRAAPDATGKIVEICFLRSEETYSVLSSMAIENSESCLESGSLFVNNNYVCDLQIEEAEIQSENDERNDAAEAPNIGRSSTCS